MESVHDHPVVIALAGQPNVGKSTIFNLLTGMSQHVGNWTGKTVERKEGGFRYREIPFHLVDLPGTYSLTTGSPEELIAREFIVGERPDLVVAVVNAAMLERSLYLVAELMPLNVPMIIALNMMDVAEGEGIIVEPDVLQAALGITVIPLKASKKEGIEALKEAMCSIISGDSSLNPKIPEIRSDHRRVLKEIEDLTGMWIPEDLPAEWASIKLLEGDEEIINRIKALMPPENWQQVVELLRDHDDAYMAVASGRYEWISRMIRAAVLSPKAGPISRTHKIDRWLTHPFWGLLALGGVMTMAFLLTFLLGLPLQKILDRLIVQGGGQWIDSLLGNSAWWLRGVLIDGVIGGTGTLLTFVPILAIFFLVMAMLEDVGYLARAAFVMDSYMHVMGLHGKSCLPLILGFGCNVPAALGTRVIESTPARLLTLFLVPLVPCTGRLAVIAFLAPLFFGKSAVWVTGALIFMSMMVLVVSGILANRVFLKRERAPFIMELPLYHVPNPRTIGLLVWSRTEEFIRKAFVVILPVSVLIWALSRFPHGDVNTGYLAAFSRLLEPAGRWMGFDWRLIVALVSGFIAKENSLAVLGVLFSAQGTGELGGVLKATYSPAAGLAFMTAQMLYIPCAATLAAIRQESGSWRWTFFNLAYLLIISWILGIIVFQIAGLVL